jgi:hypothetical protein
MVPSRVLEAQVVGRGWVVQMLSFRAMDLSFSGEEGPAVQGRGEWLRKAL